MTTKKSSSTNLHQRHCNPWTSQCFLIPVFMLEILTAVILTGVTTITVRTVNAWPAGQVNCLALLCDAKDGASFYSGRRNTGTNPDLAFASVGPNSRLPDTDVSMKSSPGHNIDLRLLHHQGLPLQCQVWNFCKAKWSYYIAFTNKFAKTLLPPDSLDVDAAYQDFCNTIKKAAKKIDK